MGAARNVWLGSERLEDADDSWLAVAYSMYRTPAYNSPQQTEQHM